MLIKSVDDIKEHLEISSSNTFSRLRPHTESAENKYIIPLLGQSMYEELEEFNEALLPETLTETQQATASLLHKVKRAIVFLGYAVGFDYLNIMVSDMGFTRMESSDTKSLFKYQEDNLKEYFFDNGFDTLDSILVFLEKHIQHFNEFKLSSNYTVLKKSFIPTVKVVEDIPFDIHNSRLTLLALKPHIFFIEETGIKGLLKENNYTEIKEEMVKDAPAPKVTAILPYIRRPLIYLASALLMEETGATLHHKGLFFDKINISYPSNREKGPSGDEAIARMIKRNRAIGQSYLDQLKSYLLKNSLDWNEYTHSSNPLFHRDNTDKKTFWA